jgi:hypothetical protein
MNNALYELGLEYAEDTRNYDALRAQIYEYYGAAEILGGKASAPSRDFNFPEPLKLCGDNVLNSAYIAEASPATGKEQFFRHLLHPEAGVLFPFVDAILTAEYKNSPIFTASTDLAIDRESIAQLVDRAYGLAEKAGVASNPQIRALLNMLVLTELLIWRP